MSVKLSLSRSWSNVNLSPETAATITTPRKTPRKQLSTKKVSLTHREILPEWLRSRKDFSDDYMKFERSELVSISEICERPSMQRSKFEKKELLRWTSQIPDLCWLTEARLRQVCDRLSTNYFMKGEHLTDKGSEANCMYLIVKGLVGVYLDEMTQVATIEPGNSIGEASLRVNGTRTATVVAHTDVTVLHLKKADYDSIALREKLQEQRETCKVLRNTVFFIDLPYNKLERLSSKTIVKGFEKDHIIYSNDDISSSMYVVKSGSVKLEARVKLEQVRQWPSGVRSWEQHKSHKVLSKLLRIVKAGQIFGEKELLKRERRTCSAVTTEKTVLLMVNEHIFNEDFTQAELLNLASLNESRPNTSCIVNAIAKQATTKRQLRKSLLDGLDFNPCPIGRDFDSPKGLRLQRLIDLCKPTVKHRPLLKHCSETNTSLIK